ncbi:MAG: hypothetical protein AAF220_06945 [Pseudomonadota bacterium]
MTMDDGSSEETTVIRFPQSRVPGANAKTPVKELGRTERSKALDPTGRASRGHWCSRCKGVWYGHGLEVECPVCGNRHG